MPANYFEPTHEVNDENKQDLTPELVRQVTDEVYKLFLKDLKQENERRRIRNFNYRR